MPQKIDPSHTSVLALKEEDGMKQRPDDRVSRRAALKSLGIGLGTVAIGCGGDDGVEIPRPGPTTQPPATSTSPTEPSRPPPPAPSAPDSPISIDGPKLSPKELLAGVEHIVVLMMENRSFDHFLGALALDPAYASRASVDGLKGTESNAGPNGSTVTVFKLETFTPEDPPHDWDSAHVQHDGGKNDGFVKAHAGASQSDVMGYHDRSQIPLYYWLSDNFAVCDRWFSSVMGPTWPNRFYLHATTSMGMKENKPIWSSPQTIWDALKERKLSAKNYGAGRVTFFVGGFPRKIFGGNPSAPIADFFDAARTGDLPSFSLLDPDFEASDDHPSHDIQRGQAFVASVYKALAEGPAWDKTLFIVTYDENGGFFDHVAPPKTVDWDAEFEQLGFRVPAFVIGPMVKKGYVCKTQLEHSSIAATLKTRWDIKSLSPRMDATNDITDCIDPAKVKAPGPPPTGMPQVAMTLRSALYDGVGISSQPMLSEMVAKGIVPALDTRDHASRIGSWLEHAVRLGAVRLVDG
jgi:phospholipase C